tara:strand:- start:5537 stop:6781 length:1245 start_codon:yes stop_codon:yes gene_type:complete
MAYVVDFDRTKKVGLIGKGTAGVLTFLQNFVEDKVDPCRWEEHDAIKSNIEWYYDSSVETQPVGEGSTFSLPRLITKSLGLGWEECVNFLDATPKTGIYYHNFGPDDYFHEFSLSGAALHFNAKKLQSYVFERFQRNSFLEFKDGSVNPDDIDADYIIDCSGKPKTIDEEEYHIPEFISVNAVHVTQCYWDVSEFQHTKTIARPYGWVFLVPLVNRCSVGYLYNKDINTLEEVKQDVENIFDEYGLTPSADTNSFSFDNYYKKKVFDGRVLHNGNKAFFLEPMEATSIDSVFAINRYFSNERILDEEFFNDRCRTWFEDCELIIMMHYAAGSEWNNEFWDYATERGNKCLEKAMVNDRRKFKLSLCEPLSVSPHGYQTTRQSIFKARNQEIGPWGLASIRQNVHGLGLSSIWQL